MVVLVTLLGDVLFGVEVPTTTIPGIVVTLIVGAFSFCALGFALSSLIPSEDAAPPITNATVLPLYFLSGVFIPETEIPDGVLHVADVFPIRHLFEAFFAGYDPATTGAGFEFGHLAIVAGWGACRADLRPAPLPLVAARRLSRLAHRPRPCGARPVVRTRRLSNPPEDARRSDSLG